MRFVGRLGFLALGLALGLVLFGHCQTSQGQTPEPTAEQRLALSETLLPAALRGDADTIVAQMQYLYALAGKPWPGERTIEMPVPLGVAACADLTADQYAYIIATYPSWWIQTDQVPWHPEFRLHYFIARDGRGAFQWYAGPWARLTSADPDGEGPAQAGCVQIRNPSWGGP